MIQEAYCSIEVAKLLKKKGFNEECNMAYYGGSLLDYTLFGFCTDGELIYAPTIQMALAWLRVEHNLSIEISSNGFLIDGDVTWECDIKFRRRLYFKLISNEKSPESCATAAIIYSLTNLI